MLARNILFLIDIFFYCCYVSQHDENNSKILFSAKGVQPCFAVTATLAGGAYVISVPWTVAAGVLATLGLNKMTSSAARNVIEERLVEHPDKHEFSPNLKKMAQTLYKKTGINSDNYPIYDFKVKEGDTNKKQGCLSEILSDTFNEMSGVPNAAASYETKPIIMISEAALKLLNDREEYAVLAHEFAHIGARHNIVGKAHRLIGSAVRSSNTFLRASEALAAGWKGVLSAFGVLLATGLYFNKAHPNANLLKEDRKIEMAGELELKKNMKFNKKYINMIGVTLSLTAFNPKYIGIYLATKALSEATILVEKRLSRSKEYQADAGAIKLDADPLALITALRKITALYERSVVNEYGFNLSDINTDDPLTRQYKKLKRTHPALQKRFNAIAKIAKRKGYEPLEIDNAINGDLTIPDYVDDIPVKTLEMMLERL